jgi:hypothetical protein
MLTVTVVTMTLILEFALPIYLFCHTIIFKDPNNKDSQQRYLSGNWVYKMVISTIVMLIIRK